MLPDLPASSRFGSEQQLIDNEVRAGKVKLVYRGLETASSDANSGEYAASQIAARAAGLQGTRVAVHPALVLRAAGR